VAEARAYVHAAQQRLLRFPDSEARHALLAVADYVYMITSGRIVFQGPPDELQSN
jgi:ABC-type lipopolysaccharide export system ATPase subunit